MQSNTLNNAISSTVDWLVSNNVILPIDIIIDAVGIGVKSFEYFKTAEQFDNRLTQLVKALYNGKITEAQFVDSMAALISRQLTLAYREAWKDEGQGQFPDYLIESSQAAILAQYDYVDSYAADIVQAAKDKTPIDGLLSRVPLWSNRYNEAYTEAIMLISEKNGGKLEWVLGATEEHCTTCSNLNGIVAYASEWQILNVKPQNAPNGKIECGGWHCDCELKPTDKRRTAGAYGRIEEAVL